MLTTTTSQETGAARGRYIARHTRRPAFMLLHRSGPSAQYAVMDEPTFLRMVERVGALHDWSLHSAFIAHKED